MACSSRAVVALLLACMAMSAAASSIARDYGPKRARHSHAHIQEQEQEQEDEFAEVYDPSQGSKSEGNVYDCPAVPKMKACAANGCVLHSHRRVSYLICNQCADEKAYTLQNAGTRKATCGELGQYLGVWAAAFVVSCWSCRAADPRAAGTCQCSASVHDQLCVQAQATAWYPPIYKHPGNISCNCSCSRAVEHNSSDA